MDNVLGAVLGIVILLVSIALFPIGLAAPPELGMFIFFAGVIGLSLALPVPIFLLERFEGMRRSDVDR